MVRVVRDIQTFKTIYNKKMIIKISVFIFSVYTRKMKKYCPKSILGFRFWTFFLSIFEKGKYFWEKRIAKLASEHNDVNSIFPSKKSLA